METDFLSAADVRNLALQRTGSLVRTHVMGREITPAVLLWTKLGTNVGLDLEVRLRRDRILKHCVAELQGEIDAVIEALDIPDPIAVMDIGCGLAVADALLMRKRSVSRLVLVDIDESEEKRHDFHANGSGYNSLETARAFLQVNAPGVAVETLNPRHADVLSVGGRFDLITSYLSCGFHYPSETYLAAFETLLEPEGRLILDLRQGEDHSQLLQRFEVSRVIEETAKRRRVCMVRR